MRWGLAVAVAAGLVACTAACSDDEASTPIIVERTDEAPPGEREACVPGDGSFTADANGSHPTPDEAFFAGVVEHDIPGSSVVVVTEAADSVHYDSYSGDELRAITGVIRTSNGLWAVGGVRYCA